MRRRRFRRVAGASAVVGGVTGIVANGLLVLYFGLARPWEPGHDGPWEWLGPANDIVGSISMAALVPVIGCLWRRVPDDRVLTGLSAGGALAAGAFALAGPLLVAGGITLQTQFVVAGVGLPVIFGWLWRACRAARHADLLSPRITRFGEFIAVAALGATGVAAIGTALPAGSVAQYVTLGVAAVSGLPAYLAFPVWEVLVGGTWWRGARSPATTGAPSGLVPAVDVGRADRAGSAGPAADPAAARAARAAARAAPGPLSRWPHRARCRADHSVTEPDETGAETTVGSARR